MAWMTADRRWKYCPVCGTRFRIRGQRGGNNPCRPCRRLMTRLSELHERKPEQLPRLLRPVRCLARAQC